MEYTQFQELCRKESEDNAFAPIPADDFTPDTYIDSSDQLTELLQTGSVSVLVAGRTYVVSLHVEEEK